MRKHGLCLSGALLKLAYYSVGVTVASENERCSRNDTSIPTHWVAASAWHRSSNSVSARKTFTTAKQKFVQRLITARAKQRCFSVQDFCVGLADPSVHELASSGSKLYLSIVIAKVNFAEAANWPFLTARNFFKFKNFRSGSRNHNGDRAYTAFP